VALLHAVEGAADHQDERGVISKYLQLLDAMRALKIYLARERGRTPNTSDIDKYGKLIFNYQKIGFEKKSCNYESFRIERVY